MKVFTVLGTRPEIIRLSLIIPKLDALVDHTVIHTGQNYDRTLSDIFFEQLSVRQPDYYLGARGTLAEQTAKIFVEFERIAASERPDRLLVLGDTNSALVAFIAKRLGIPVFHMEAGNRCFDDRVPEEVNRRVIDHCSDILMPYTERSRQNLIKEGFPSERVFVTGNPIGEILQANMPAIEASDVLDTLELNGDGYFLVTLHRAENVDRPERLRRLVDGLAKISVAFDRPVLISTHPHTRTRLGDMPQPCGGRLMFLEPFGFFDFVKLTLNAFCVLSDSGTVQEETAILRRPNVTLRDVTERPETVEVGSNILAGADPDDILRATNAAVSRPTDWDPPAEYIWPNVSSTAAQIVTGFHALPGGTGASGG